jgi:hypothetical protein
LLVSTNKIEINNVIRRLRLEVTLPTFPNDTELREYTLAWGARGWNREVTTSEASQGREAGLILAPPVQAIGVLILLKDLEGLEGFEFTISLLRKFLLAIELLSEEAKLGGTVEGAGLPWS